MIVRLNGRVPRIRRGTVKRAAAVGLAADRRLAERRGPRADRPRRGLAAVGVADPAGRAGTLRQEDHGEHVPALAAAALERRGRHRAAARQVTDRISLTAGRASSVAVSPDGSKLYAGVAPPTPSGSFRVLVYEVATGIQASSSQMP